MNLWKSLKKVIFGKSKDLDLEVDVRFALAAHCYADPKDMKDTSTLGDLGVENTKQVQQNIYEMFGVFPSYAFWNKDTTVRYIISDIRNGRK